MKKFFGIVGLIFCVFLASCNFSNFSDKTGSLEFSIPLDDIVQSYSQSSARAGTIDGLEVTCLFQVQGNKRYYKSKADTMTVDYSVLAGKGGTFNISFDSVPANQVYKVMFDLFVNGKADHEEKDVVSWRSYSGKVEGVSVTAGKSTSVDMKAKSVVEDSFVNLVIEFEGSYQGSDNLDYYIQLEKKNNALYYMGQKISDIKFVRDPNCNFTNSSFKYNLKYLTFDYSTGAENALLYELSFKDNVCSIKDFLLGQKNLSTYGLVISNGDVSFMVDTPEIMQTDVGGLAFDPSVMGYKKLTFTKSQTNDDGSSRYCAIVPFADMNIFDGQGDVVTAPENGSTVMTIVNISDYGNSPIRRIPRIYYMLYEYSSVVAGETYAGNQCITLPPRYDGEYSLIMPFNNLQEGANTKEYWMFFFDINSNATEYEMYYFSSGSLLPSDTYVFSRVSNYEFELGNSTEPWVNELKVPMVDSYDNQLLDTESSGKTVWVYMSGEFNLDDVDIYGEIFDSARDENGKCYHDLSNSESDPATVRTGYAAEANVTADINLYFYQIRGLPTNLADNAQHACYFQCQTSCDIYDDPLIYEGNIYFQLQGN